MRRPRLASAAVLVASVAALLGGPAVAPAGAGLPDVELPPIDLDPDTGLPVPGGGTPVAGAPLVATGAPAGVSGSGATLNGFLNPSGLPTTYRFEYGPTPAYGNSTPPQDAGSGIAPVAVSATIGGLEAGSLVHYRLVASNPGGEAAGLDRVLILPGLPGLPGPPGGAAPSFTDLSLPLTATVAEPVTLRAGGIDPDAAINSIAVDFGEGPGYFAESACRLRPPASAFEPNQTSTFSVPYAFTEPGVHTVEVTLGSGDCGRTGQLTTETFQVNVAPAPSLKASLARIDGPTRDAIAVEVAAAGCKGAGKLPRRRTRRAVENATVCVLNKLRRQHGLRGFRKNGKLRRAASSHNSRMMRARVMTHRVAGEPDLGGRLRRVGYRGGGAENIGTAVGRPWGTARGMARAWMGSAVHRANILERRFRVLGVSVVARKPASPATPGATYTINFGTTRR